MVQGMFQSCQLHKKHVIIFKRANVTRFEFNISERSEGNILKENKLRNPWEMADL